MGSYQFWPDTGTLFFGPNVKSEHEMGLVQFCCIRHARKCKVDYYIIICTISGDADHDQYKTANNNGKIQCCGYY